MFLIVLCQGPFCQSGEACGPHLTMLYLDAEIQILRIMTDSAYTVSYVYYNSLIHFSKY